MVCLVARHGRWPFVSAEGDGGYILSLMELEAGIVARWEEGLCRKVGGDAFKKKKIS
jgi:hypothetical protein